MPADFLNLLTQNVRDMSCIAPELMVMGTFLLALVFDLWVPAERRESTAYICILGLLAAMCMAVQNHNAWFTPASTPSSVYISAQKSIFAGMLIFDRFGSFFKLLILLGTVISLIMAVHSRELKGRNQGEFFLLLAAACLGGMFLSSATHLLMIYLSIETLSIVSYALAGYLRQDKKSAEAGVKYVVYGAMASGIMIFGMSYLYGLTGTLNLYDMLPDPEHPGTQTVKGLASLLTGMDPVAAHIPRGPVAAILLMVFAGFLYKIAAVPFHYWSPDVYEGAPTTATGFFSVVPKAAGFAVLIRVLCKLFPVSSAAWMSYPQAEVVLAVLAVLTMTLGNLAALGQSNAKRMLAYSSIAHAGYMLAGLSVLNDADGPAAVLFYLIAYLFMNLGAFLVIIALENSCGSSDLDKFRGAVHREPVLGVALCVFLFSLTGLPPLAGFTGKYLIMLKLADQGRWLMIFWIGINSMISLYYYVRLAKAVVVDKPEGDTPQAKSSPIFGVLAVCHSLVLLGLFVYVEPVRQICAQVLAPLR